MKIEGKDITPFVVTGTGISVGLALFAESFAGLLKLSGQLGHKIELVSWKTGESDSYLLDGVTCTRGVTFDHESYKDLVKMYDWTPLFDGTGASDGEWTYRLGVLVPFVK